MISDTSTISLDGSAVAGPRPPPAVLRTIYPAALAAVSMVGPDLQMSEATWTCTKESQNVPVGVGMPTVKIDGLTIGGTEARR